MKPSIVQRGDMLTRGEPAAESWVEFADVRDGTYPLDAATEALDFLRTNREEFVRLSSFPGVITRSLSFFGDADSCSVSLTPRHDRRLKRLACYSSSRSARSRPRGGWAVGVPSLPAQPARRARRNRATFHRQRCSALSQSNDLQSSLMDASRGRRQSRRR